MRIEEMETIQGVAGEVETLMEAGRKELLPIAVELTSLIARIEVLEGEMKSGLEHLAQDAQRSIEYMEKGYSLSMPDTGRIDSIKAEMDAKEDKLSTLARVAKWMLKEEEK